MIGYPILDAGVANVGDRHAGHVDDGVLGWREKLALVGHLGVGKINIGTIDMFKECLGLGHCHEIGQLLYSVS